MYRGEGQIRVGGQVVDVEWDVSIQRVLIWKLVTWQGRKNSYREDEFLS